MWWCRLHSLADDRNKWRALVNTALNIPHSLKAEKLINWASISASIMTILRGINCTQYACGYVNNRHSFRCICTRREPLRIIPSSFLENTQLTFIHNLWLVINYSNIHNSSDSNVLSPHAICKNLKTRAYEVMILAAVLYGSETWCHG
jgi:hypothetical protein